MNIDDLVTASLKSGDGSRCWARHLNGEVREYLTALDGLYHQFDVGKVVRILDSEFGVKISTGQLRNHYRGDCTCPKIE